MNNLFLVFLRAFFLVVAAGVGFTLTQAELFEKASWAPFPVVMFSALAIIAIDVAFPRKRIELISSVYIGVVVALFLSYLVSLALSPFIPQEIEGDRNSLISIVQLLVTIALGYTCISLLIQTKDDFRFVIPYVEFAKEVKGLKPLVLDTSVVIDGRIADVVETGILDSQLIMPRFVLAELQSIADSSDRMRRARGRRGLDILNRLRNNPEAELKMYEREHPDMTGQPVDMKLVLLASHLEGKIVTGDYNLNKVARLHNVPVINLNDVANSLKPVFLPGEHVTVRIVKPGEEEGQGVGYLDDGTMIVIENGRPHVGENVNISVTSVLQTSAGRMIFGRYEPGATN